MKIQIVGQEDVFQKELVKNVLEVLKELKCGCEIEVIREIKEILAMENHRILMTPALIVNGHILCEGHIWTKDHIRHFMERAAAVRSS